MTGCFFFPLRGGFSRFAGAADFRGFMHWIVASGAPGLGEMNVPGLAVWIAALLHLSFFDLYKARWDR